MGGFRATEPRRSQPVADSEIFRQAAAEVLGKVEAAAGMAADDGLAFPKCCRKFGSRFLTGIPSTY